MVGLDTLYRPVEEGGLNLLDLHARLEAIETTWLKPLTDLTNARPAWSFVHDAMVAENIQKAAGKVPSLARIQTFLQTWNVKTSALPEDLKRTWSVVKKYNVSFAALKLSRKMKKKLPMWYHLGAKPILNRLNNAPNTECLRENHGVRSVGDIVRIINRRDHHPDPDRPCSVRRNCACLVCRRERAQAACENPTKCYRAARTLLDSIHEKWHPDWSDDDDDLSLTRHRKIKNMNMRQCVQDDDAYLLFDPSITTRSTLEKGFRIFTDPEAPAVVPGRRNINALNLPREALTLYTDGSCLNCGDENAMAGAGVFYAEGNPLNAALKVPGPLQSNQAAELAAITHAASNETGRFGELTIISDSLFAIDSFTARLDTLERNGFIGCPHRDIIRAGLSHLRRRGAPTYFKWTKGHAGNEGNTGADILAGRGALLPADGPTVSPEWDKRYVLSGAQISTLTQNLA